MDDIRKEAIRYDIGSLKEGITKCDKNIQIFEDAIKKEEETKRRFRQMITVLEEDVNRA